MEDIASSINTNLTADCILLQEAVEVDISTDADADDDDVPYTETRHSLMLDLELVARYASQLTTKYKPLPCSVLAWELFRGI